MHNAAAYRVEVIKQISSPDMEYAAQETGRGAEEYVSHL